MVVTANRNGNRKTQVQRRRDPRCLLLGLAVLCSTWLVPSPAGAQEEAAGGAFEIGMDLGWTGFHSDLVKPNGSRISLYGAYFLTRRFALVADITCLGGSERAPADSLNFTLCTGSLSGSLDVPVSRNLVPYLRLGVGQAQLDRQARMGIYEIEDRSAALEAAVGSRIYFGARRRLSVRADAMWTRTGVFDAWATHPSVAIGIVYRIERNP